MRKVHLTQQEMLKFMKEKRQDLQKYYEARQEMNDRLEKDDVLKIQRPPCMHRNFKE